MKDNHPSTNQQKGGRMQAAAITLFSYFTKKYGANKMSTTYVVKILGLRTGEAISGTSSQIRFLRPPEAEILCAYFRSKLKPAAFKEKRLPDFDQSKRGDFTKVYLISYFKKKYQKSWSGIEHICQKLGLNLWEANHGTRYRHVYLDEADAKVLIRYLKSGQKLADFVEQMEGKQKEQEEE